MPGCFFITCYFQQRFLRNQEKHGNKAEGRREQPAKASTPAGEERYVKEYGYYIKIF